MKKSARISLADVAREAGVSRMTVSLALREDGRIPAATRERVVTVARRIGYRANPTLSRIMAETARTRHRNDGGTLGFIVTEPQGADFPGDKESFVAVSQRAADYGYRVERFWISDPKITPARFNRILWSRGIAGLIIPNISHELYVRGQRTLPIEWEKFCVVEIADAMLEPVLNRVRHNHFGAMINAFEELETLGYRRIGFCTTSEVDLRTHHRWSAAFLLWRSMRPKLRTLQPLYLEEITPDRVVRWARKNRLEAVLSPGVSVLRALRAGGIDVPGEIGFATLDAWGFEAESITGVFQERNVLAGFAVDMLVTLLHRQARGIPAHALEWLFHGKWVAGETTRHRTGAGPLPRVDAQSLAS